MKFRTVLVALAFVLLAAGLMASTFPGFIKAPPVPVMAADAPAKAPAADPNAPISIETLANSRAVVTDRIQQLQAALSQLEGNKKQLDVEIERRVAADKAKAKK